MTTPEQANESVNGQPIPAIGLIDLQNAIKIIDYAAEQGAFKGWAVIEQVIAVRNKINQFVQASTPPEQAAADEEAIGPDATAASSQTAETIEAAVTEASEEVVSPKKVTKVASKTVTKAPKVAAARKK